MITSLVLSAAETSKLTAAGLRNLARPYSMPLPEESQQDADRRLQSIEQLLVDELARSARTRSAPELSTAKNGANGETQHPKINRGDSA